MTSYNILTAPTLVNLLADLGVIKVTISSYGRSIYTHRDQFFVDEYAGKWVEEKVKKLSDNLKGVIKASFRYYQDERYLPKEAKEEKFRTRARCTASRWGFIILSDGKVIPCDECPVENDFIVGDVTNKSIMDVWKSSLNDNFVTPSRELFKGTVCYECVEFEGCSINGKRCFRDAFKAYGSVYTAPPDCPIAPESPRLY
jgi:radical SAM protein with 4Fe4S-binding SPASM domain